MKLYSLLPDLDYNIYTGLITDGRQVILSHYGDSIIAVYFDAEGNFLSYEEQVLTNYHSEYDAAIKSWMDKLNLTVEPISIKQFFLNDRKVGIKDLTDEDEYFLGHEAEYSETERVDHHQRIKDWQDSGEFVFWWANDFWCDAEGLITDS